ncbi:MAG TPA: glycosyl transferase family protein [Gammaproteobacteria bacterium]|nr:glycosyl transferase family protein [Gammaproteobacteria bacterium]
MSQEHPFAQYVRILGKGKNGSRPLTRDEAYAAFRMILAGEVLPEQLGAFLMLMRVKEETPEELAGFIRAVKESLVIPENAPKIHLDWSSYAGKRRHLPWFILATLLLAQNGVNIFMHGASGHTAGRLYTKDVLAALGITPCTSLQESAQRIRETGFAYLDLEYLSPKLHEIIELRPLLGLRSPVHTIARMLNPFDAPYVMQGIFHPGYRPMHQEAALLLGQPHLAVIKGDGGEIERDPDAPCLVQSVHDGKMIDEEWPALYNKRHVKDAELNVQRLRDAWEGKDDDEYGIGAVIGTTAIALKMMGRTGNMADAETQARALWEARNKGKFGAAA